MTETTEEIKAQPGPQTNFLSTSADIAIYGGAAGGGKTYALLLESCRHIHIPGYNFVIFRRTSPEIRNPGGMWHESFNIYPEMGGEPREQSLEWRFNNSLGKFGHLNYETSKFDWKGAQIAMLGFDELTEFSESQFFYLLSRNRSTCGIRPYVRATTNPDADSWVAKFISWWINQETGFTIKDRLGKIRYFVRVDDELVWANTRNELKKYGLEPKSVTFIEADIYDNPALMEKDPAYLANLQALSNVERERLLHKNWKITFGAGKVINRAWFVGKLLREFPAGLIFVRGWDLAATEKKTKGDKPAYTASCKMGISNDGKYYCQYMRYQLPPSKVKTLIINTAEMEPSVFVGIEQEPAASGKIVAYQLVTELGEKGVTAYANPPQGDKVQRALGWSAQAEAGNMYIVEGQETTDNVLSEFHTFPDGTYKDMVDATSTCWFTKSLLNRKSVTLGYYDL